MGRIKKFIVQRVLGIQDTPHRIAMGVAIGIFVTWTPTIPFQMILTVLLATLFRANKVVGLPFVWISNPLTIVPLYGFNFLLGCWLLPGDYSLAAFRQAAARVAQADLTRMERLQMGWDVTVEFFWPLWLGSVVVGLFLAIPSYLLVTQGVRWYQQHRRVHCHEEVG